MSLNRGTCATCAYYQTVHNECRYNPPTVVSTTKHSDTLPGVEIPVIRSHWPKVDNNDWCSHWYGAIMKSGERKNYARQINDGHVTFIESEQCETKVVQGHRGLRGEQGEPG